jgi:hypothetical protein
MLILVDNHYIYERWVTIIELKEIILSLALMLTLSLTSVAQDDCSSSCRWSQ